MVIRTVRMTFRPTRIDEFIQLFNRVAPTIRSFDGCQQLELWQDVRFPHTLTSYSVWESEESLDRYRHSDFFRETWSKAKDFFDGPAGASSQRVILMSEFLPQPED